MVLASYWFYFSFLMNLSYLPSLVAFTAAVALVVTVALCEISTALVSFLVAFLVAFMVALLVAFMVALASFSAKIWPLCSETRTSSSSSFLAASLSSSLSFFSMSSNCFLRALTVSWISFIFSSLATSFFSPLIMFSNLETVLSSATICVGAFFSGAAGAAGATGGLETGTSLTASMVALVFLPT